MGMTRILPQNIWKIFNTYRSLLGPTLLVAAAACSSDEPGSATNNFASPEPASAPSAPEDAPPTEDADAGSVAAPPPDGPVWPNSASRANSDPWLTLHHDEIAQMRPNVLAINFANPRDERRRFVSSMKKLVSAIARSSRFHGYADPAAPVFLNYQILKTVDLSDHGLPPPGWDHYNGSRYPLKCNAASAYQFDYLALFTQKFADAYGIPDPANPSRNLTLGEMIQSGFVHEVWVNVDGDPDAYTCPNGVTLSDFQLPEFLELKPKYDLNGARIPGAFDRCAGNGCFEDADAQALLPIGRSVRILFTNAARGSGCALHSLSHGVEHFARGGVIPSLKEPFLRFANFDLRSRLGLSFDDWYSCSGKNCLTYTGDNSLTWNVGTSTGAISPLNQGCGSVHFPPNARAHYDDTNSRAVRSTCEHFAMKDGPNGNDTTDLYTKAKGSAFDSSAPDCQGGWITYWRQNIPGYKNKAIGADGKPMRNWWPYLFY